MPDGCRLPVTVVIPTHNRAQLLLRSARSVLAQTFTDFELLIVDDASTDETQEVPAQLNDERVRVLRLNEQHGAAGARNAGIDAARGVYIAFQDSDDAWLPDKLEKQLACLQATGADAVFCAFHRCHEDGTPWQTFPHDTVQGGVIGYEQLLFENLCSTQTLIARIDLLRQLRFDERYPALEDWDLALRLAKAGKLVYLPEPLVDVTLRPDSISTRQDRALTALKLMDAAYGRDIRADEKVCAQWMAGYVHAGRGCGHRAWRECLSLLDARHSIQLNAAILLRAAKELLRPVDKHA